MPVDKSNGCGQALSRRLDMHRFTTLRAINRLGKIDKIRSTLSSNDLVVSCKKGRNFFYERKKK